MYPFQIHFSLLNTAIEMGPYELFFILAIATSLIGCFIFATKKGFNAKKTAIVLIVMLISAVAGARILNALINLPAYTQNPEKLFTLSPEGFSLYGGVLMAVISGYTVCRILKINPFKLGDTFIPFLGLSIAIMRIGCFLNGCCFGQITSLPWGIKFPMLSPAHLYQIPIYGNFFDVQPVHPTQLYELAIALILSVVALRTLRKKRPNGTAMFIFLTVFSLFRLFNSYLRVNPDTLSVSPYFYPALYLSIAFTGIFMIWKTRRTTNNIVPQTA